MVTKIILKNSPQAGKVPTLSDIDLGEIAINTYDGDIYLKRDQDGEMSVVRFTRDNPVENVIYVQKAGDDNNRGDSWDSAYLTIEKALEDAWTRNNAIVLIEIGPGIYTTRGNLDMPDNSIIHCTYRSVIIRPETGYEEVNVFRMGSGCFIEGPLFEGFRLDNLDNPTVGFAAVFRPGALIVRTPYVHKIAVRSIPTWTQVAPPLDRENGNPYVPRGGGVVMADGAVISPYSIYPNMMTWGATPVIHNGVGYVAKNGGLVNAVNAISIWAHKHFLAIDGGQIVLSACSTQFGDYTLVSQGTRKLIQPYEVDIELTQQVDSANAIYSVANTIIDGMYNDLAINGFANVSISGEVSEANTSFEQYTKRDANIFLRSLTWTLSSGNEKPMLDFAKGFYDTQGNITFQRTDYDFDKCFRDVGLISDAVAYDILFGSNYRSITAAKSYYRANANTVIDYQKDATILAIQEQKNLVSSLIANNTFAIARSNSIFDEFVDIITNGEAAADEYVIPDPIGYDAGFFEARRLLISNKVFIQNEVVAWIGDQVASNTSPFNSSFLYNEASCSRDVGLIIDALRYDLTYRGNLATVESASAYFIGTESQYGEGQKQATIAALQHLQNVLGNVLQGSIIIPSTNNVTLQDTSGTPGSLLAATFAQSRIGEIISTISSNGVLPKKIFPDTSWPSPEYQNAFLEINNNMLNLTIDVMIYITQETKSLIGSFIRAYEYMVAEINSIPSVTTEAKTITELLVKNAIKTLIAPVKIDEPSVITAIGHTWTGVFAGVALTKMPPATNQANIQDSILELDKGVVIASGQDDQGSALFVGGLEINSDTGELAGPPFQQAVNRISTRAAISRSF